MKNSSIESIMQEFNRGLDCGQIVAKNFTEKTGLDENTLMRMTSALGAGMFKTSLCGALTGAYIVLGLVKGFDQNTTDKKGQTVQYINKLDQKFKEKMSSLKCSNILGASIITEEGLKKVLEENLIEKRCCLAVKTAIESLDEILNEK